MRKLLNSIAGLYIGLLSTTIWFAWAIIDAYQIFTYYSKAVIDKSLYGVWNETYREWLYHGLSQKATLTMFIPLILLIVFYIGSLMISTKQKRILFNISRYVSGLSALFFLWFYITACFTFEMTGAFNTVCHQNQSFYLLLFLGYLTIEVILSKYKKYFL